MDQKSALRENGDVKKIFVPPILYALTDVKADISPNATRVLESFLWDALIKLVNRALFHEKERDPRTKMMTVEDVISAYRDLDAPVALSQESEEALFKRFNDVIVQIYSARALEKYWEVVALLDPDGASYDEENDGPEKDAQIFMRYYISELTIEIIRQAFEEAGGPSKIHTADINRVLR